MFTHQAYGLSIYSDFDLPELRKGKTNEDIDLYIQKDSIHLPVLETTSINRQGNTACFGVGNNHQEAYLQWSGVGAFLAKNGSNLIVDSEYKYIEPEFLNLYILSEALGIILYQRGFFLLHASAIKIGEYAVVIVGAPGTGKSTMAAAFAKYGYPVLADDMVAIHNIQDIPTVCPAFPQIKIWPTTIKGLDFNISNLPPLFSGSQKRVIRQPEKFALEPCPLAGIFALDIGAEIKMTPMEGSEAFMTLTKFFPCPAQLLQNEALEKHFSQCIQLLENVPMFKLERPQDFSIINQVVSTIENQVNSLKNVQKRRATV